MTLMRLAVPLTSLAVLLTLGLTVLTLWRAGVRDARAAARAPDSAAFVTVDGIRLRALVQGDGPDLVLIHGSSGNVNDFKGGLIPMLSDRYRVIALDRPGLGWSDPLPRGRDGIEDQARVLAAAARAQGARAPVVLGQSYGGAVALAWAVTQPDTIGALVLVSSPSQVWQGGLSRYYRVLSHPLGARLVAPLITAFVGREHVARELTQVFAPAAVPAGYLDRLDLDLTLSRKAIRENARQRARLKADIGALAPRYGSIDVPVEIVHGDADRTVSVDLHARPLPGLIPDARLTILKGVGHMPHHGAAGVDVALAIDRAAQRAGLQPPPAAR